MSPSQMHDAKHRNSGGQTADRWIIAVLACIVLIGGAYEIAATWYDRSQHYVSAHWKGNAVTLSIPLDSPYQVTCLAYDAPEGEAIAELPEPIYLIESGGKTQTEAQTKRLIWRVERTGKQTLAPTPGTPIWAMYARMNWSPERAKKRTY